MTTLRSGSAALALTAGVRAKDHETVASRLVGPWAEASANDEIDRNGADRADDIRSSTSIHHSAPAADRAAAADRIADETHRLAGVQGIKRTEDGGNGESVSATPCVEGIDAGRQVQMVARWCLSGDSEFVLMEMAMSSTPS